MPSSADTSFRLIASSKKLLTRVQLAEASRRASTEATSLETAVSELGFLNAEQLERIQGTRERHARECSACAEVTYLLPKQIVRNTSCEHCQKTLVATSEDNKPRRGSGKTPRASGAPVPTDPTRPTGRRIHPKAPPPADSPPSTVAQDAARAAALASESVVDDITFSAPTEEIQAAVAEARAKQASTPGPAPEDDDDLQFQSVAYDPAEIAKARAEAEAEIEAGEAAAGKPKPPAGRPRPPAGRPRPPAGRPRPPAGKPESGRVGPPRSPSGRSRPAARPYDPEEDAPTIRPTRDLASAASPANAATPAKRDPAEDAPTLAPQSAIGSPVGGAAAANLSAREMRQAGGGFGYEPPEALVPRLSRPGLPSTSAAETVVGEDAGEETIDEPPPTPQGGDGQPTGRRLGSAASPNDEESAGDDADDDRFAPPAEHLEEHGRPDDQDVVIPPLREDLVRVLKLPLTKSGIGMLCVGTVMMSMFSVLPITPWTLIPALLMLSYPLTFLISCTRNGSLGREVLPDWPDFDVGLIGNGWRTLQVYVACALPGIVILLPLLCLASAVGKADKVPTELFSIGTEAHSSRRAEADWHVKKGTDVLGVKFLEPGTDAEIEIGAEWTVIGFLNRSNGDDTGTTETFTDIGAASAMGMAGVPAFQVHDLDRVGRSFRGKVKVLAAYADPDERIIQGRFGWLRPPEEEEEEEEDEEDEPDVDPEFQLNRKNPAVQDALNKVTKKMTFNKNYSDGIQVTRKFVGVEIVKTEGWAWPGPFEGIRPLPVVYVVDASGKIAKEYGAGVDDEQLYGDLQSLMDGGDGNTPGDSLPTDIKPSKGLIFALLKGRGLPILGLFVIPFVLFGFFYWPAAQLIMVSFDSGNMAFNYPATIRAIRVGFRDYLFLVGIIFGLSVAGGVLSGIIRMILFFAHDFIRAAVAGVFSSVFVFYSQIVGAYAIGRYYHANKESIGWFTK